MQALAREVSDTLAELSQKHTAQQAELAARSARLAALLERQQQQDALASKLAAILQETRERPAARTWQLKWARLERKAPVLPECNWGEGVAWLASLEKRLD
jgi:hypothetical protein